MNEIAPRQSLINQDNAVHYVNAYLNYENLKATTELTGYVAELNQSAQVQLDVSRRILASAINTNAELKQINQGMQLISAGVERLADGLERQEQLHREHYDSIKRERAAKETIYQFERYLTGIQGQDDGVSKAFGSRRLLAAVELSGFTTSDLGEISDKRYFDEKLQEAREFESSLSDAQLKEVKEFELLYASFHALSEDTLQVSLDKLTPIPENGLPQLPKLPKNISQEQLTKMQDLTRRSKNATRAFKIGLGLALLTPILSAFSSKGDWLAVVAGVVALTSVVLAIAGLIGIFIFKAKLAVAGKFKSYKEVSDLIEKHNEALKHYQAEVRNIEEIQLKNERLESKNREILTGLDEFKVKIRNEINAFIDRHPRIESYCQKV